VYTSARYVIIVPSLVLSYTTPSSRPISTYAGDLQNNAVTPWRRLALDLKWLRLRSTVLSAPRNISSRAIVLWLRYISQCQDINLD
jgi:hypothetical protein